MQLARFGSRRATQGVGVHPDGADGNCRMTERALRSAAERCELARLFAAHAL